MNRTLLALPLALAALAACGKQEKAPDAVTSKGTQAIPVEVGVLEAAAFRDTLELVGKLEAYDRVRITAELAGRIESVPFDEGETVRRGQTVARIDAKIASAQLSQAKAQLDLATATLNRTEKMAEKGLSPPAELEVARAQKAQAEASAELAEANLDKAVIRAPISGVATNVTAKRGEVAGPGVPLLEIVRVDRVKVVADAPERDVSLLEVGSQAAVSVPALPGRELTATVENVGIVANSSTRTFPVELVLDNDVGELRPGMLANIRLLRKELREVVVIPRDAVLDEAEGKSVFVDASGVAARRSVEVGSVRGRFTVAREGLKVGDRLIVLGHRQVVDGQKIVVNKAEPCCAEQAKAVVDKPQPTEEPAAVEQTPGKKKKKKARRSKRKKSQTARPGPKTAGNAG